MAAKQFGAGEDPDIGKGAIAHLATDRLKRRKPPDVPTAFVFSFIPGLRNFYCVRPVIALVSVTALIYSSIKITRRRAKVNRVIFQSGRPS
jgi:hypothetical protein